MKAAILHEIGQPLTVESVDLGGSRSGEVRVRVAASHLCHSDYHLMTGHLPIPLPAVPCHEVTGHVEAVGEDVPGLAPGDLVVSCYSAYCGQCGECQTGYNYRCIDKPSGPSQAAGPRISLNGRAVCQVGDIGGFAEAIVVHHRALVKLPKKLPVAAAPLLGWGVLTGVSAALSRVDINAGSKVAVVGCGGAGLNVIQGVRIAGAGQIVAVDLNPHRLELPRAFGATDLVLAGPDSASEVTEITQGGVDFAFEVIGVPSAMRDDCRRQQGSRRRKHGGGRASANRQRSYRLQCRRIRKDMDDSRQLFGGLAVRYRPVRYRHLPLHEIRCSAHDHSRHHEPSSMSLHPSRMFLPRGMSSYCAAKAAVEMLGKSGSIELAEHGIRVDTVSPGLTKTPPNAVMPDAMRSAFADRILMKRAANPEEQAKACLFLGSDGRFTSSVRFSWWTEVGRTAAIPTPSWFGAYLEQASG